MDKIPYELIAKYLSGECLPEEERTLERWLDEGLENRKIFEELSQEWSAVSSSEKYSRVKSGVWSDLENQIYSSSRRVRGSGIFRRIAGIAAAVVMASVLTFAFLKVDRTEKLYASQMITVRTMPGQKSELELPDGTRIWLNSESEIVYPADYNINNRNVSLTRGEAFFDVAKSETSKFMLNAGELGVKVYGTRFNVRKYDEDPEVDVALEEGHIDVLSPEGGRWAEMFPGQKFTLEKATGDKSLVKCDAGIEGIWRMGELVIDQASFDKVLKSMERWYGVRITVSGEYDASRQFWMTIKTESLREMLDRLDKLVPFSYDINGGKVTLKLRN